MDLFTFIRQNILSKVITAKYRGIGSDNAALCFCADVQMRSARGKRVTIPAYATKNRAPFTIINAE